jgi:hypothetical protein
MTTLQRTASPLDDIMVRDAHLTAEDALPKIHVPLDIKQESVRQTRSRTAPRRAINPADAYANEIIGAIGLPAQREYRAHRTEEEKVFTIALPALRLHWSPAFIASCMAVFLLVNIVLVLTIRPELMASQPNEDAELIFEPSRISEGFAKEMERPQREATPSIIGAGEEEIPLSESAENTVDVPSRRVIVVTEGDREKLLKTLKEQPLHHSDTENLDTYMNIDTP